MMGYIGYFQGAVREWNTSSKSKTKQKQMKEVLRQFDIAIRDEDIDTESAEVKALMSKMIDIRKEVY